MTRLGLLLTFIWVANSCLLTAQVLDAIDVELIIKEKTIDGVKPLPLSNLVISDLGEIKTDSNGNYNFTYAVRNEVDPILSIGLPSPEHKMLKPVDGSIELDPTKETMQIEFIVVNMKDQTPAFQKRINQLEKRIRVLQQKNTLSNQQLNALNQTLLDTILFFEANKQRLENQIAEYQERTDAQSEEIEALQSQILGLESQVDDLTFELEEALEAQYLRQNEYFTNISSNLMAYVRKAKDLRDHMPFIGSYFNTAGGYSNYDNDIKSYNKLWEEFDNNRPSYIEGVERYWEDKDMSRELEEVFNFLVKGIHQNQILTVVRDINAELYKQKPKKAQKIADIARDDMSVNIRTLEQRINRIILQLRKNI